MGPAARPHYLPKDYNGVHVAGSLKELFNTPFRPANVILYPRSLPYDFTPLARELVSLFGMQDNERRTFTLDKFTEAAARLREETAQAAAFIQKDIADIRRHVRLSPELRLLTGQGYNINYSGGVYKFHADGPYSSDGRVLCSYTWPGTQGVPNEDAEITEDGRYLPKPGARIFSFKPGDISRHACPIFMGAPEDDVPPFIHRAPDLAAGAPRLLLAVD